MVVLHAPSQPHLSLTLASTAAEQAIARLFGLNRSPTVTTVPYEAWLDLECDGPEASRADLRGHRGVRVSARRLGLDDDGLATLFALQDRAFAGEAITLSQDLPQPQTGRAP